MTQAQVEQGFQEIWTLFKETDAKFKETEASIQKTSANIDRLGLRIDRVSQNVDKLTGKWGRFVEGIVSPGIEKLFQERGIKVKGVFHRAKMTQNGRTMEVDLLVTNEEYAVLVEAKSSLSVDDVKEHLQRLEEFKIFFPEHRNKKVYGAVAGIVIEEGADRFAYKKGLFVLAQAREMVKILNDDKFKPRIW